MNTTQSATLFVSAAKRRQAARLLVICTSGVIAGAVNAQSAATPRTTSLVFCSPSAPLQSELSLGTVALGDPCQLPASVLEQPVTAWIQTRDTSRNVDIQDTEFKSSLAEAFNRATKYALRQAETEKGLGRIQLSYRLESQGPQYAAELLAAQQKVGSVPQVIVLKMRARVCGVDKTNALNVGNAMRVALESRYGKPTAEHSVSEFIRTEWPILSGLDTASLQATGDNKTLLYAFRPHPSAYEFGEELKGLQSVRPKSDTFALKWTTPSGSVLSVINRVGCSGERPTFDFDLSPDFTRETNWLNVKWLGPVRSALAADQVKRQQSGAIPKF